jgi:tRNA (cytidine/uridine-2'-O-)-methyltransferase
MFSIVLLEPEIPPNTGNIIRLAANTGSQLHLIEPMGFKLEDKQLRRAGLDYREWAKVCCYQSFQEFIKSAEFNHLYGFSTKAKQTYTEANFAP